MEKFFNYISKDFMQKNKINQINTKIEIINKWEINPSQNYLEQEKILKNDINKILTDESFKKFNLVDLTDYLEEASFLDDVETYVKSSYFNQIKAILHDEIIYLNHKVDSKEDLYILKLREARYSDLDFEEKLALLICGDNTKFPYRSSYYLTKFFKESGFNYEHDGSTRYKWVADVLKQLNLQAIFLIVKNLFKRKYFVDFCKQTNQDLESYIKEARNEFSLFITECLKANDLIDLSSVFDLNLNTELLFDKTSETKDSEFNNILEKAKNFYIEGQKQEAIEKLWDAFERIKTYLIGKDKKEKAESLIKLISNEINSSIFETEFKTLTDIGNNYMIRHAETDKIRINDNINQDYLFFRMLALLNLAIQRINLSENKV